MEIDPVAVGSMIAAFESAKWTFWSMVISASSAFISLLTVIVAFTALRTWRDEAIENARREWKKSIIDFTMRLSNAFDSVNKQNSSLYLEFHSKDLRDSIDRSIACWSSLLVALEQNKSMRRKILKKYAKPYMELINLYEDYVEGKTTRDVLLIKTQELYVFPPELIDYF